MSRKCLDVSVLSTVQPFWYLLMKYPLSPETGLALLHPLGCRAAGGLLRRAHCFCRELLSTFTLTQAWLSPRHFAARHFDARSLSSLYLGHTRPWFFFLPFWCIQSDPLAKTRNSNSGFCLFSNSLGRALHICNISSCFLKHFYKGCLQAAQWIWWDVWHQASSPFQFIHPVGPTRVWWCPCPDNSWFPLQLSFSLPHFFDGSNFCQQIALSSPSHCKKEGHVCRVKKLWPTCRQVLRTCCGCAVTHISWEADVS